MKSILSNLPKPDRERVLAFCRKHGPISHGIGIWRKVGEVDWHTDFRASYYTTDLRAAREGTSRFLKYLGKVNLESKIAECLFEFANHLKYSAKLEALRSENEHKVL